MTSPGPEEDRSCPARFDAASPACHGCTGCQATEFLLAEIAALTALAGRDMRNAARLPARVAA